MIAEKTLETILPELPVNDLNLYAEMANEAGEKGDMEKCFEWYKKGLQKAKILNNKEKIREYSNLLFTLL